MASIDELKNNNISIEIGGEEQDPDSPKPSVEKTKTVITGKKSNNIKPKVNVKPKEEEEIVIDPYSDTYEEEEDIIDDIIEDVPEEEENMEWEEDDDWNWDEPVEESSFDDEEPEESFEDNEDSLDEAEDIIEEEEEEEEIVAEETPVEPPKKKEKKDTSVFADDIDMEEDITVSDIKAEEEEVVEDDEVFDSEAVNEDEEDDESLQRIKDQITEKLKPVSRKLDISSFSVVKKPTMNVRSLDHSEKLKVSKWVCYDQKTSFLMKEFLGSELELIRQLSVSARNNNDPQMYQHLIQRYTMIYNHIVSPKPESVEAWLNTVSLYDVDDYFFGIYISAFKDTNFIPVDCGNSKCDNTFITDDIPIMNMVKFPNEDVKKEFTKLYKSDPISDTKGLFASEVIPISDNIAVGFKQRSVFSEIQKLLLDEAFINQYILTVDLISYIDAIYIIDQANSQLIPVGYKEYVGNNTKTLKSKIKKYHTVLSTLTSDEYNTLVSYRSEVERKETEDRPVYIIPEIKCDKCGHVNEESETSAESLVFTRCQLAALSNTSIN